MARSYSRIASSIWRDADFVALPPEQKLTYLMLISQADVSPCGLLSMTLRRWANALGLDVDSLRDALDGLAKERFVVFDEHSEELLIRSFVKWDGGLSNDNRAKAIVASVAVIASDSVFNVMVDEMTRLGSSHGLTKRVETPIEPPSKPVRSPSEGPRVVVTLGDKSPQPTTLIPAQPTLRIADRFDEFWKVYPRHVAKRAARKRWDTLVANGTAPQSIIDGATTYATEVRGKAPEFIKQPDGWLLGGRWEDEPAKSTSSDGGWWNN